ncbi:MAG: hypothetical protein Ct9H300mP26_1800 [Acidimicrobiales bacterium]|nr:MAG: hypothetical protein Ct9H300mP26_1800 [Acidimicrobiales bacterium]
MEVHSKQGVWVTHRCCPIEIRSGFSQRKRDQGGRDLHPHRNSLPVFIVRGQVDWGFAVVLAVGFAIGGWLGARLAVRGGEKIIRPVLIAAVVALAGRMIGLY